MFFERKNGFFEKKFCNPGLNHQHFNGEVLHGLKIMEYVLYFGILNVWERQKNPFGIDESWFLKDYSSTYNGSISCFIKVSINNFFPQPEHSIVKSPFFVSFLVYHMCQVLVELTFLDNEVLIFSQPLVWVFHQGVFQQLPISSGSFELKVQVFLPSMKIFFVQGCQKLRSTRFCWRSDP